MLFIYIYLTLSLFSVGSKADLPCVERFYYNRSSVCVCNNTYCDTVTREVPLSGTYVSYTSSKAGSRFKKSWGQVEDVNAINVYDNEYGKVFELRPDRKYQTIVGFGGAVTDAAGINWKSLPLGAQQFLVDSYYSKNGLEYNMIRLPVGSTDFSTHNYTYNEYPEHDIKLSNYTLAYEDHFYKAPLVQKCKESATDEIKIVSASWSPPNWMKSINRKNKESSISEEYYQTFADYLCRFAQLYKELYDIDIWAMTPTNEPFTPIGFGVIFQETAWTSLGMAKFIKYFLGPTMRNCTANRIKVLANDDQRNIIPLTFGILGIHEPDVYDFIDGIAVHFYNDKLAPPAYITYALKEHPTKFIISTEACAGAFPTDQPKVDLGSWDRAKLYANDILEDLNYNLVGWIDWNLCLDKEGGPNWVKNFVDSAIIVDKEKEEFLKQPMFYSLGQFSKFIPRGSQRIKSKTISPILYPDLDLQDIEVMGQEIYDNVAFITPKGTIVFVIHNHGPAQKIAIQLCDKQVAMTLEAESITTVEIPYDGKTLGVEAQQQ